MTQHTKDENEIVDGVMSNFIMDQKRKVVRRQEEKEAYAADVLASSVRARTKMFSNCVRATEKDYTKWLHAYIVNGGKPTHLYNQFSNQRYDEDHRQWENSWYLAKNDFEVVPLYGSTSANIIVPFGISFSGQDFGHNNFFLWDGLKTNNGYVPFYCFSFGIVVTHE